MAMSKKDVRDRIATIAAEHLSPASEALSSLHDDMMERFDEGSERWQEGDGGDEWNELMESVESARDEIDNATGIAT